MKFKSNPFLEEGPPPFNGFPEDTFSFFRDLKRNNNREWFQDNKHRFESSVRAPMESLLAELGPALASEASDLTVDPKKSIYRIYRDTRFSKDKTPYKTWVAASFTFSDKDRKNDAGYYFHISDDEFLIAGGLYAPSPLQLKKLRAAIDADSATLRAILRDKKAKSLFGEMQGDSLARVPQGFNKDHPDADLLKRRQLLFWKNLNPDEARNRKVLNVLTKHFIVMTPFLRWLADNS